MRMSQSTYNALNDLTRQLSEKIDIPNFRQKMLDAGNSETRFIFDILYMINVPSDLYKTIYGIENLNDSHIETAMKKILKGYN